MRQLPTPNRSGPPYNPGVRDLVAGKQKWSSPRNSEQARRGYRGWHERGYLPHRDQPGLVQFVTFELADCFPVALRSEWEHYARITDNHERRRLLEAYLDRGLGQCYLKRPDIAATVEENFRFFSRRSRTLPANDASRVLSPESKSIVCYELRAWIIMPNHVHVLFKVGAVPMSETVGAWKKHTGRLANELLGRRGPFWAGDYFDVYMRDADHERKTIHYIEHNPVKAKLVRDPRAWTWSSARFRDENGNLHLPD